MPNVSSCGIQSTGSSYYKFKKGHAVVVVDEVIYNQGQIVINVQLIIIVYQGFGTTGEQELVDE